MHTYIHVYMHLTVDNTPAGGLARIENTTGMARNNAFFFQSNKCAQCWILFPPKSCIIHSYSSINRTLIILHLIAYAVPISTLCTFQNWCCSRKLGNAMRWGVLRSGRAGWYSFFAVDGALAHWCFAVLYITIVGDALQRVELRGDASQ